MMNMQLPLAIKINDDATLASFNWATNPLLEQQIKSILQQQQDKLLYVWGTSGSGKSHLLQACCQAASHQQPAIYLPLKILKEWGPEVIDGLEEQNLICIDDIDAIAGQAVWEEALFHLYNRIKDSEQGVLIISGNTPPTQLPIQLPDLRSRLAWGLIYQLNELDDEQKIEALCIHASKRGINLPNNVGHFLLNRCSRNMHDLHELLNRLDDASLAAQRKITIPFTKEILDL